MSLERGHMEVWGTCQAEPPAEAPRAGCPLGSGRSRAVGVAGAGREGASERSSGRGGKDTVLSGCGSPGGFERRRGGPAWGQRVRGCCVDTDVGGSRVAG